MAVEPVLIGGAWRAANSSATFHAENPATGEALPEEFPVSSWADGDAALDAAAQAAKALRTAPPEQLARFLTRYADRIEARAGELVETAHRETALPKSPRLAEVELPRTTDQLRQAAAAARDGSWAMPTIDTPRNIRSLYAPLGPVWVFGPNNFPFAFNSVAGGDFAAALASGNPVVAKANPSHPRTTERLAEEAFLALAEAGLPPATVQLLYHLPYADGERLAADPRTGALAYTGSRHAGLKLKAAADKAGTPAYFELSSVNPVLILPGALAERGDALAGELAGSCLLAAGQFCTSPGIVLLFAGEPAERFLAAVKARLEAASPGPLLSAGVLRSLGESVEGWRAAGAQLLCGGSPLPPPGYRYQNTLLRASGQVFLASAEELQREAFGNASLLVVLRDPSQAAQALAQLEGNLTGSIYSDTRGGDDALYNQLAPILRARVGRLLNDKMPTGVAVSPAMHHGGPFPATGHPGFTSVGIPASLRRFAALECYDHVPARRLPAALQDANPNGRMWRLVDGVWTQASVARPAQA